MAYWLFAKNCINSPERILEVMQQWSCNGIMTHAVNFSLQATKGWRKNFSNVNIKKKLQLLTDGTVQRNQFVVSPGAQLYVYSQLVHRNYPAIPTSFSPFHSWFWGHINVLLKQTSNREWITAYTDTCCNKNQLLNYFYIQQPGAFLDKSN